MQKWSAARFVVAMVEPLLVPDLANFSKDATRYPYLGIVLTGNERQEGQNAKGKFRHEVNVLVGKDIRTHQG